MGVDWIPCRVEAGWSQEEMCELVRREALYFRSSGSSIASSLDPRVTFSDLEKERVRQAYLELGPLHRKLLFKYESHRTSVISGEALFPIEWRIDAERTILPWELSAQLARWNRYRDEVAKGMHRPFLQKLYAFNCIHELVMVDLADLIAVVDSSLNRTGSWAKRPEVVACRDEILAKPILTRPIPPSWPEGGGDLILALVESALSKVKSAVSAWNDAVKRGNVKLRLPTTPLDLERWVESRLNNDWYSSFLAWVEPWSRGGYGLYRDCE